MAQLSPCRQSIRKLSIIYVCWQAMSKSQSRRGVLFTGEYGINQICFHPNVPCHMLSCCYVGRRIYGPSYKAVSSVVVTVLLNPPRAAYVCPSGVQVYICLQG